MALIDTFLKLMVEKRAERLVLVSDAVPYLLKGGETIPLSMPSLRGEILQRIWREMGDLESSADLASAKKDGSFHSSDHAEFTYRIQPSGADLRIEIQSLDVPHPTEPALAEPTKPAVDAPVPIPDPVVRSAPDLLALIDQAVSMGASDIFLSSGKPPRMRRDGVISRLEAPAPDEAQILQLIPNDASHAELSRSGSVDFAARWELSHGSHRVRANVFRHLDGLAAALRPIRQRIPSPAELNLPESLLDLTSFAGGLVLVTGTSSSGKSTTLAALIDHLNRTRARHIITIEDPIEFEHRENQCLIHQREVGTDVESFTSGLRAALRENPDVILLGELRDLDTISAALTAAETGHLVFGTLHSGSASAAVNRIIDVFPGHQQANIRVQLASSLRAVVSQRLVPARGKGMVPALEKLLVTPAVANGIREGHEHYLRNAMYTGTDEGMITLERSLAALVRAGTIDKDTALRHAPDQKALSNLLG